MLRASVEPVVVDVGDDDVARADVAGDRRRHDADRAGAGDQHVLADQVERQRGVRRVAEGIEDRRELVGDVVRDLEGVERGDDADTRRSARAVDADADGVAAEVAPAGAAVAAVAAGDVALAGDAVADLEAVERPRPSPRSRRRTRGRRASAPEWSSAPTRPSCRCACRCRRSPSCGSRISTSLWPTSGFFTSIQLQAGARPSVWRVLSSIFIIASWALFIE